MAPSRARSASRMGARTMANRATSATATGPNSARWRSACGSTARGVGPRPCSDGGRRLRATGHGAPVGAVAQVRGSGATAGT